ncbi:polysaccharide biosynthesis tyrosine autokinase [Pseudotenacibaculum sp. MALMAid0570]|uniref:GumC family protein n=1 Tax=Pseudotenacibaculum sp. MALMAid0570 TaxID=3143938 RepID=UPI0032DE68DD
MQQHHNYTSNHFGRDTDTINFRVELEKYFKHWKWFLLGVVISFTIAYTYLRYSTPQFSATASIMIKDNKKSGISPELEAFKDMGIIGVGSSNNTDNEIEIIKSRKIIGNVVDTLNLGIYYYVSGRVKETEIYGHYSPIIIEFEEKDPLFDKKDTIFNIKLIDDYKYEFRSINDEFISSHTYEELIKSSLGSFKIKKNKLKNKSKDKSVSIRIRPKFSVVASYRSRINVFPVNKNSSVINLSLDDPVREKAEVVLDELVRQYNLDAINDKNQVSEKTKEFIDARLKKVSSDLILIDTNVEEYKTSKDFTGLPDEAKLVFEALKDNNQSVISIQTQLILSRGIEESLTKESKEFDVLPSNLGFENVNISQSIIEYNTFILNREKALETAGPKNPLLRGIESQIKSLRSSLLRSLSNVSRSLELQLNEFKKEEAKVLSRIKSIPAKERGYIDIAREQEIIAGLYSYLLKKKEETDISLAVTVPNAKIIDSAYSSNTPVWPSKKIIYLISLFLGIVIPFVFIYIIDIFDTKVHNKQHIESELSIPFLGDVPKSESKEKVVIGHDVRSSSAEAFRLIRTNLDFMLASNRKQSKSIFITSTTSGEGKSFVSINLAATLALSGKKILLMGMDLRAPKVIEYLGVQDRKGITNYITDDSLTLEDIKFSIPQVKGLDIIASGVVPPNPAELLMTKRVENLFTIVKQEYDIVIVDTAPVNLVTDTLLIAKYADMFMYVVRANYLDKRLLAVPQGLYNEKRLPNMAIVLNDTDPKRSYGYGYGGYGYGYVVVEKPWYKKIFSRD